MTKPLLSLFFDGLGYDSISNFMPFLNSLNKNKLFSILGYSVTCHASMYTGLYPERHDLLFIWKRSPETSPFKHIGILDKIPFFDNKYLMYIITRLYSKLGNYNGYFGLPRIEFLPYKYWPQFDVAEKKFWDEDRYLLNAITLFEIIRSQNLQYQIIGMDKTLARESYYVDKTDIKPSADWIYLFIGDFDFFTHRYTKNSCFLKTQLSRIDDIIRKKYERMKEIYGDFNFIAWSDHGHITIHERIDLYDIFNTFKENLNDYLHCVEATFARFWFRNEDERQKVINILSKIPCGSILYDSLLYNYRIRMRDNKYGDLLFLLKGGFIFRKTIWGNTDYNLSMHGYAPEEKGYQSLLVTNFDLRHQRTERKPDLTDILPTHLKLLNLKVDKKLDGFCLI